MHGVSLFPAINARTAAALVISAMIGTGVYTTLGFQLRALPAAGPVLLLWVVGGMAALCGAVTYGRLARIMPGSGGEYLYLSRVLHPVLGFASGFVSATVGFAAPIALSALAFGSYFSSVFPYPGPLPAALILLAAVTVVQLCGVSASARWQQLFTTVNISLIFFFIAAGLMIPAPEPVIFAGEDFWSGVFSAPFAMSLVYVSYAYSGWNTANYMAGEVKDAGRSLSLAPVAGTGVVTVLYVLLNYVFLRQASIPLLSGKVEVAHVVAVQMLGESGAIFVSLLICAGLCASVSSMMLAGPYVAHTMGSNYKALSFFKRKNKKGAAYAAIGLVAGMAVLLALTSAFEAILTYIGFTVSLFTALAAVSLIVLYGRRGREICRPRFLVFPVVFIFIQLWMTVYVIIEKPFESLAGFATLAGSAVFYSVLRSKN